MAKKAAATITVTSGTASTKPEPLHVLYRPRNYKEVVGQDAACKVIDRMIAGQKSQAYLLTGPSGAGKTTLARIAARQWGCTDAGIAEIDAATNSGVDHVRSILDLTRYMAFGGEGKRAIIIDEAHGLSRQSWDALLKSVEEPPPHVVWFILTTNPTKVPQTIKTRCTPITLKAVDDKSLGYLCDDVCDEEGIKIDNDVFDVIIREAMGSARQMLVNLELCRDAKGRKEAEQLLIKATASDAVLDLCRFLMRPQGSWGKVMGIINRIESDSHEGTRIQVCNYFGAVAKNAKNDKEAIHALSVIGEFVTPYNQAEGIAPLLMSVGRVLFSR